MRGLARIRTKLAGTNGTARAADRKRIASLEQKVERLKRSSDTELMKVLRRGYAAGPLVPMGYPGAELQLVAAAQNRQDEHESEPYISTWIERCFTPDDVFYDIGANVGTYSLIAASVALPEGRAFAFEPSFSTYAVLCENVFVNGLGERIATLPVALGATTGLETFHYSSIRPGAAKHNWPTGEVAYSHEVLSYRLDDLVRQLDLPLPRHIKIDVDGGEPDLLRGAAGGPLIILAADVDRRAPALDEGGRCRGAGRSRLRADPHLRASSLPRQLRPLRPVRGRADRPSRPGPRLDSTPDGARWTHTRPRQTGARDRRDRQQPRRLDPTGRAAGRGGRRGGRRRRQVPDPHRRGGDAPSTPTPPHFPEPRSEFTSGWSFLDDTSTSRPTRRSGPSLLLVAVLGRGGRAARGGRRPALQDRLRGGVESAAARGDRRNREARALSTGMSGIEDVERAPGPPRGRPTRRSCSARRATPARRTRSPARDGGDGERLGLPYGLSDHTPDIYTRSRRRPRRVGDREALHALEAAVRARPPRVARRPRSSRGSWTAIRQVEAALGNDVKARDPALDPARATFEKAWSRASRSRRAP